LQAALRQVVGVHVEQKGSLNNSEYLRFDFSHFAKLTTEEIQKVEDTVNAKILENVPVFIQEMPKAEALKLGATALFGEKYGDIVRVVVMDPEYSVELCGGTHVGNTGEIGLLKIITESAVAAGVRRIEAVAGEKAIEYFRNKETQLHTIADILKKPQDILKSVQNLVDENALLKKQIEVFQQEKASQVKETIKQSKKEHQNISYVIGQYDDLSSDASKQIATELRQEWNSAVIILTGVANEKPYITVAISDDLVKNKGLNAGKIVKELAVNIKGGGGGQPFIATAGGLDILGIPKVIEAAEKLVKQL
jgi:alanyl-tRNA synthetase